MLVQQATALVGFGPTNTGVKVLCLNHLAKGLWAVPMKGMYIHPLIITFLSTREATFLDIVILCEVSCSRSHQPYRHTASFSFINFHIKLYATLYLSLLHLLEIFLRIVSTAVSVSIKPLIYLDASATLLNLFKNSLSNEY